MKVAGIVKDSVVDGIGIRDVIFLQGCCHQCKGCHNPETWDMKGGTKLNIFQVGERLKDSTNDITISGGEPLLQFNEVLRFMCLTADYSSKRFWLYTGFTFEEIPREKLLLLSKFVDVLVDGRYEEDKRDLNLLFRGSSNQRLIDLPKSIQEKRIVLWEGYK